MTEKGLNGIYTIVMEYVTHFKKQQKGSIEVYSILNSKQYSEFINKVYQYYNKIIHYEGNARLSPKCYIDADKAIDYFWELLMGTRQPTEIEWIDKREMGNKTSSAINALLKKT